MSTSRGSRHSRPGAHGTTGEPLGEGSFRAVSVRVEDGAINVVLDDGREASASIGKYFPFLGGLTEKQLRRTRLDDDGRAIYFPAVDEYASVFSVVHPELTTLARGLERPKR